MRRSICFVFALILILGVACSVSAVTGVTQANTVASVSPDESCAVTLTVTVHLDAPTEKLTFPVPKDATAVTLNGSRVMTTLANEAKQVSLSRIAGKMAGDFTFTITYRLSDVVNKNEEGFLQLQLPLLCGFAYPVQKLDFTVTLPGTVSAKPSFSSGYHLAGIEQQLVFYTEGSSVVGSSVKTLKDRETLTMTLSVTEEMFPQSAAVLQDFTPIHTCMILCAVVAALYWLLFLRSGLPRFPVSAAPMDGYTAGQLGSITHLQGADLTMMVFSWAQLGYVLIQIDKRGRVSLHKRMDMGNERSAFERKCFQLLFGKRSQVDTSGYHYVTVYQKVEKLHPGIQGLIHPKTGSVKVFRALAAGLGLFGGVCLGMALGAEAAARGFIIFLMGLLGAVSSWHIHLWAYNLFRRGSSRLLTALALSGLWILLMCVTQQFQILIWVVIGQLLAGLMAAFGGRRTEEGRQTRNQAFGMYRYLRNLKKTDVIYICRLNPEYFHTMAPYALAMGADKAFAKSFGSMKMPECPYLVTGADSDLTAAKWSRRMHDAIRAMDQRRRWMKVEKLMSIIQSFRK